MQMRQQQKQIHRTDRDYPSSSFSPTNNLGLWNEMKGKTRAKAKVT